MKIDDLSQPAVSPNGQRIAFIFNGDVWKVNLDGSRLKQRTSTDQTEAEPVWAPDSQSLALVVDPSSGVLNLWAGGNAPGNPSKNVRPLARVRAHWREIMGKQRKKWPTDTKEQIVLAVLGGQLSVAEAARQHGVNESLIHTWKAQFLEAGRARLAGDRTDDRHGELERENERLKALVGEKELALHIAKKARGL